VPQRYVLGPILFIVYIKYLNADIISNISKFANDTKTGSRVDKKSDRQSLQNYLKIITWSKTWQINFNADKCKIIHFASRKAEQTYSIEDSILQAANKEKDLGVIVDKTLKFLKQCSEAVKNKQNVWIYS